MCEGGRVLPDHSSPEQDTWREESDTCKIMVYSAGNRARNPQSGKSWSHVWANILHVRSRGRLMSKSL